MDEYDDANIFVEIIQYIVLWKIDRHLYLFMKKLQNQLFDIQLYDDEVDEDELEIVIWDDDEDERC